MYLSDIVKHKRVEVETLPPLKHERARGFHDPVRSLRERPFIAEIKKRSPSMGEINSSVNILDQAAAYVRGGAGAVSVLTDSRYFGGSFEFLYDIGREVEAPLLCKDFIVSEIQVENARRAGADFILLIAAILDRAELASLTSMARDRNMKVLYEIHEAGEFLKLEGLEPEMVGVNARNLKTFGIDLAAASGTIREIRSRGSFLVIAESGINSVDDVRLLGRAGADAFLIGTSLMKSDDPGKTLAGFFRGLS